MNKLYIIYEISECSFPCRIFSLKDTFNDADFQKIMTKWLEEIHFFGKNAQEFESMADQLIVSHNIEFWSDLDVVTISYKDENISDAIEFYSRNIRSEDINNYLLI